MFSIGERSGLQAGQLSTQTFVLYRFKSCSIYIDLSTFKVSSKTCILLILSALIPSDILAFELLGNFIANHVTDMISINITCC